MVMISFQLTARCATTLGNLTWYPRHKVKGNITEFIADGTHVVCAEKTCKFQDEVDEEKVLLNLRLVDHPHVAE